MLDGTQFPLLKSQRVVLPTTASSALHSSLSNKWALLARDLVSTSTCLGSTVQGSNIPRDARVCYSQLEQKSCTTLKNAIQVYLQEQAYLLQHALWAELLVAFAQNGYFGQDLSKIPVYVQETWFERICPNMMLYHVGTSRFIFLVLEVQNKQD